MIQFSTEGLPYIVLHLTESCIVIQFGDMNKVWNEKRLEKLMHFCTTDEAIKCRELWKLYREVVEQSLD